MIFFFQLNQEGDVCLNKFWKFISSTIPISSKIGMQDDGLLNKTHTFTSTWSRSSNCSLIRDFKFLFIQTMYIHLGKGSMHIFHQVLIFHYSPHNKTCPCREVTGQAKLYTVYFIPKSQHLFVYIHVCTEHLFLQAAYKSVLLVHLVK